MRKIRLEKGFQTRLKKQFQIDELRCCKCGKILEDTAFKTGGKLCSKYSRKGILNVCKLYCLECSRAVYVESPDEEDSLIWEFDSEKDCWILEENDV